jgi:hypothetical protein
VDLVRGVGQLIGWERIDVPGATGYLDTDYAAKGRWGTAALAQHDVVCVHVEAPDEASHEGRLDANPVTCRRPFTTTLSTGMECADQRYILYRFMCFRPSTV